MYTSKLFAVLRTFEEAEWKGCQKFLSMYGSSKTDTAQLYKYIYTHRKNLDHKKLDASLCRDKIFPQLTDKSFRNILSKLHRIIEDYIVWQRVKNDRHSYDLQLFEALDDRGVDQQADKVSDRINKSIEDDTTIDVQQYYVQHKIAHARFYSDNPIKYKIGKQILFDALMGLTHYYESMMNLYKAELHNNSVIYNDDWVSQWKRISTLQANTDEYQLTELLLNITTKPDDQVYHALFNILKKRQLSLELSQISLISLLKYLKKFNYKGERLQERFKLMQFGLEKGIYLDKGTISAHNYWNILNMACTLNEIPWGIEFRKNWSSKLSKDDYHDLNILSEVRILFATENFTDCLRLIAVSQMDKLTNERVLMKYKMMAAIECFAHEQEYCIQELKKYHKWVKYNDSKQQEFKQKTTTHFIQALNLLIKQDGSHLQEYIEQHPVSFRKWFVKKLEAIKAPSI